MASEISPTSKKSLLKRPLFKRPVVSKITRGEINATDLFSRSNSSYLAVAEEEERKLQRRAAKAARRDAVLSQEASTTNPQKRQRSVSTSSSSSEEGSDTDKKSSQTRSSPYSPPQAKRVAQFEGKIEGGSQETITASKQDQSNANEDDDDLVIVSVTSRALPESQATKYSTEDEEEVESDEELAELARQAREAAKIKLETSQSQVRTATHSVEDVDLEGERRALGVQATGKVILRLVISSKLPGVESKRLKVPLEKKLRYIRAAWCRENGFTQEDSQDIVLVFKGKRLFGENTPASLGITVDDAGNAQVDGDDSNLIDEEGRVVMEAIHEIDVDAYIESYRVKAQGESQIDVPEDEAELPPPPVQAQESSIKIICRARGLKDFKVLVKNSSDVARLSWAFIMNHQLPQDSEINIMLDGDILAPETTMAELGVDDMDIFDVQVKTSRIIPTAE